VQGGLLTSLGVSTQLICLVKIKTTSCFHWSVRYRLD